MAMGWAGETGAVKDETGRVTFSFRQ